MPFAPVSRRRWLAGAAAVALPLPAWPESAPTSAYAVDGPARIRPLAVQAVCLDVVLAGRRLVAAGERGHVLLSDDAGVQWRQASAVPTRTTLTALHATDDKTLWAVGHGGVVLASADAGEHWTRVAGRPEAREVLLSVRVEPDGRGLAVGAFGYALRTVDGGARWERIELLPGEEGERHLNRLFVSEAGTWLIAAEGGLVLRGEERGGRWQAVKTPYAGSLWSGAALAGGVLLACGMRGRVARSVDDGRTWMHQAIAGAASLTAIAPFPDGGCALVGVDGTLVLGAAGGEHFRVRPLADRSTLTGLVALTPRALVASSVSGMRRVSMGV